MRAPYVADVDGLDGCSHQYVSVTGEGHAGGEGEEGGVREACGMHDEVSVRMRDGHVTSTKLHHHESPR